MVEVIIVIVAAVMGYVIGATRSDAENQRWFMEGYYAYQELESEIKRAEADCQWR